MQPSFFDDEDRMAKLDALGDPLKAIEDVVDWGIFHPILRKGLKKQRKSNAGRPPFPPILMFKMVILQSLYNLSDEQAEFQTRDRLTFQRFLGLSLEDRVPDAKTLWLFRESLKIRKLDEKLFAVFGEYLDALGLEAQQGTAIDARIVEVPKQRNSRAENETIKDGCIPSSWMEEPSKLSQKDTEARWTRKNNKSYYGYKNHISVDVKHKFVRRYTVTPANVHDSNEFEMLLDESNACPDVYADSAYRSEASDALLESHGYRNRVHYRQWRDSPLTPQQIRSNKARSRKRVRVEHVFGHQVKSMGLTILRAIGLERVRCKLAIANLAYNMRRLTLWEVSYV